MKPVSINSTSGVRAPGVLHLRERGQWDWVQVADIVRFEGRGSYSLIYTRSGKVHLMGLALGALARRLPYFVRLHRSHLVNPVSIVAIEKQVNRTAYALLDTGEKVTISRRSLNCICKHLSYLSAKLI